MGSNQTQTQMSDQPQMEPRPTFELEGRTFIYFKCAGWRLRMATNRGTQFIDLGTHVRADVELAMADAEIRKRILETIADAITLTGIDKMVDRTITWADAITEWGIHLDRGDGMQPISIATYVSKLRCFAKQFMLANRPVNAITADQVIEFVNGDNGLRAESRQKRHFPLRQFLDWCAAKGYVVGNPARVLKRVNVRALPISAKAPRYKEPWDDAEIDLVLAYLGKVMARWETRQAKLDPAVVGVTEIERIRDRWRVAFAWRCSVILARYAGLRMGDCLLLEWDSILPNEYNGQGANLLVYTHKKDRRLSIPMPPQIRALIPAMLAQKNDDRYVFKIMAARYHTIWQSLPTNFTQYTIRAGVKTKRSFHGLRVTYAFRCREAGMPTENIGFLLTHLDAETTALYLGGPGAKYPHYPHYPPVQPQPQPGCGAISATAKPPAQNGNHNEPE
jgi:integrase